MNPFFRQEYDVFHKTMEFPHENKISAPDGEQARNSNNSGVARERGGGGENTRLQFTFESCGDTNRNLNQSKWGKNTDFILCCGISRKPYFVFVGLSSKCEQLFVIAEKKCTPRMHEPCDEVKDTHTQQKKQKNPVCRNLYKKKKIINQYPVISMTYEKKKSGEYPRKG